MAPVHMKSAHKVYRRLKWYIPADYRTVAPASMRIPGASFPSVTVSTATVTGADALKMTTRGGALLCVPLADVGCFEKDRCFPQGTMSPGMRPLSIGRPSSRATRRRSGTSPDSGDGKHLNERE